MRIAKVLNNNVVVINGANGQETVLMGKGIGFQKKPGQTIQPESVEKTFVLKDKQNESRFRELITKIPLNYFYIAEEVIRFAKKEIQKEFGESIYIALTDHIASAIERQKQGIELRNVLLWDIKQFYPVEFSVGKKALELIREDCGVTLLEDEAAFIALHFVNAQIGEDVSAVYDMTKLIQDIIIIVKRYFNIHYDLESMAYFRFVNHLRAFAQRVLTNKKYDDDVSDILITVKKRFPEEYRCAEEIAGYIEKTYGYVPGDEEIMCITLHIARVLRETQKQ